MDDRIKRDMCMAQLRQKGWLIKDLARVFLMSETGVRDAIKRVKADG